MSEEPEQRAMPPEQEGQSPLMLAAQEKKRRLVSAAIGFMMMALSTPCVFAFAYDVFIAGTDNVQGATLIGVFCAFVAIAGAIVMRLSLRRPVDSFSISRELERQVLQVARDHGGRLTVAELAVGTELNLDECKAILEHLESREAVRTHLSSEGHVVYVVPGFVVDKAAAVDPLNDAAVFDAALGDVEFESADDDNEVVLEQPEEAKQESF